MELVGTGQLLVRWGVQSTFLPSKYYGEIMDPLLVGVRLLDPSPPDAKSFI